MEGDERTQRETAVARYRAGLGRCTGRPARLAGRRGRTRAPTPAAGAGLRTLTPCRPGPGTPAPGCRRRHPDRPARCARRWCRAPAVRCLSTRFSVVRRWAITSPVRPLRSCARARRTSASVAGSMCAAGSSRITRLVQENAGDCHELPLAGGQFAGAGADGRRDAVLQAPQPRAGPETLESLHHRGRRHRVVEQGDVVQHAARNDLRLLRQHCDAFPQMPAAQGCDPILWHERGYPAIRPLCCADGGAGAVGPSISRRSAVPPRRRGSARHLALQLRNRYAPVPLAVMCRAEKAEIFRVRAAALSDRQQVVELQQMGGGTAPAGDRITIAAASLIALPHQAPDGGGKWRAGKQRARRDRGHPVRPARSR